MNLKYFCRIRNIDVFDNVETVTEKKSNATENSQHKIEKNI